MSAVDKGWLENRPKGTVIRVTDSEGHRFLLEAEGGAFRDFILHKGTPAYRLQGRRARYGGLRLYWSADQLAGWVADGLCTVDLASRATKGDSQ